MKLIKCMLTMNCLSDHVYADNESYHVHSDNETDQVHADKEIISSCIC